MKWLENYATANSVAYSILLVSLVAVVGLGFASIKIRGIGLGVTGVLFAGLIFGHFGFHLEHHTLEFLRDFGLILFVFTIGLQIGPGFFICVVGAMLKRGMIWRPVKENSKDSARSSVLIRAYRPHIASHFVHRTYPRRTSFAVVRIHFHFPNTAGEK
jgi:hypothetical protein